MANGKARRADFPNYDAFVAEFRVQKPDPVYLFIGKEDFLVDECVDRIVDGLIPTEMRGFNLDVMYGSKSDAKDVLAHAASYPMMGERRVVIVKEFEKLVTVDSAKEMFGNYAQRPLDSTCLVLVSQEPDFRKRPFTDLKKTARIVSCDPLYDNQVPAWISARVRKKGRNASLDACRLLQAYVGNSLRTLDNELDKLLIYIGERKEIVPEDIAAVVGATKGYTIFDLQNCVGRRDVREAMTILARMMEAGENPQMMIVMLTRFFTTLLRISELKQRRVVESQFAAELGVNPYFLRQYLEFYSNFSSAHIENAFHALLSADAEMKSTSSDPRLVMDLLVYSLAKGTIGERVPMT